MKAQALVADGDLAIVTDADAGLQAPDERPPRTVGNGPDDGAFFCEGLVVGLAGRLAQFAVDFVLIGVRDELVEEAVGADQFDDLVGDQEWDETFLPVIVAAFDFPFGLGGWGIEQFDPVEVEGLTELGEGVGVVGIEEGVVVHVESEGQAVGLEDAREEVEVGQQGFAGIKTCARVQACGVIQNLQQDLLVGAAGQPGMGRGVVLPERAVVAGLPAFDGFSGGFVTGVGVELVGDGPAADAGAVGFEVKPAVEFTGGSTVGGGRLGGEEFGEQRRHFGGPVGVMIAAGQSGRPGFRAALGTGAEILAVELVEAGA